MEETWVMQPATTHRINKDCAIFINQVRLPTIVNINFVKVSDGGYSFPHEHKSTSSKKSIKTRKTGSL